MLDAAGESFRMHGAREAMANGLDHIRLQIDEIEDRLVSQPALIFGHAKSIVESACKKILKERGVDYDNDENMSALCKKVRDCLPMLPVSAAEHKEVRNRIDTTLRGLSQALDGVTGLRNLLDAGAHGSADQPPQMERAQALLAAQAADTLVGFFYRMHVESVGRRTFADYSEFNDWVDETHGPIEINGLSFSPAQILHRMEPETYRIGAAEFYSRDSESEAD